MRHSSWILQCLKKKMELAGQNQRKTFRQWAKMWRRDGRWQACGKGHQCGRFLGKTHWSELRLENSTGNRLGWPLNARAIGRVAMTYTSITDSMDMNLSKLPETVEDRSVHGVTKSQARLSNCTTTTMCEIDSRWKSAI